MEEKLRELLDEYYEAVSEKERLRCVSSLLAVQGMSERMAAAFATVRAVKEQIVALATGGS